MDQPDTENIDRHQFVKLVAGAAEAIVIIKACQAPGIFALILLPNCGI